MNCRTGVFVISLLSFSGATYADTIIYAGALIDGVSDAARAEVSIVVSEGKFEAIEEGYIAPNPDDSVIDLREYTVMPGLMDMHVHLRSEHSKDSYTERFFMNRTDFALRSTVYAKRTLMAGFTTVRDLGDDGVVVKSLKNAINRGWIVGPRIFAAGKSLATTGGHADPTNGLVEEFKGDPGPKEGVINGADDARKAVRQRYKDGADLIKITATGGVLSLAKSGQNVQFTDEELEAIVETARDYGFAVAAHAHGAEGMKRAVEAGVDSIEHGTFLTDEIAKLMKGRGTYFVPTLMPADWSVAKSQEPGYFPEVVRRKALETAPYSVRAFQRAYEAGVKIAFGTDTGVSPHGDNAREFELMVNAGMPPMETIQSATMEGAKLLRVEDTLGSVEVGKIADLVAVRGDPLENIGLMRQIAFVMKDGVVYRSE